MPTFPYVVINAFTKTSFGGNPAAIVLLPPASLSPTTTTTTTQPVLDTPTMIKITKSFSLPITVFLSPSAASTHDPSGGGDSTKLKNDDDDDDDGNARTYDIRFFVNDYAPLICGHGMFATVKAICTRAFAGIETSASANPEVRFRTASGLVVRAAAVAPLPLPLPSPSTTTTGDEEDGESYAIELPLNACKEMTTGVETDRVRSVVASALGKDPEDLGVRYIARGGGKMSDYLMVVLDESETLEGKDIDSLALRDLAPFIVISLSHATPDKQTAFVSRVFAPLNGLNEDHVCGSAHTLMLPYYATQKDSGVVDQQEAYVRQVSPRGGELWVTVDAVRGVMRLRGNAKLFAKGELTF
ncbi:hypothetical protein F5I97DRAFT_1817867 [Phlebopus sp. FC_14]|nr:hypothetical protein F5I97DRAFT_1817867 [Phlebopus sp. FC_14]